MKRFTILSIIALCILAGASYAKEDATKPSMVIVSDQVAPADAVLSIDPLFTPAYSRGITDEVITIPVWAMDPRVESVLEGTKSDVFRPPVSS